MSARDSESGSSTYKGGSGRAGGLGNGGIGGGMGGGGNYGGGMGGGAGRMGGIGSRTGLTTGTQMYGGMAFGRPGGNAMNPGAWGIRPQSAITQGPLNRPTRPGLLGNPTPTAVPGVNPVPEDVPMAPVPNVFNQDYLGGVVDFRNMINGQYGWNDQPITPGPGPVAPRGPSGPWPGQGVLPMARNPKELSNYNWSGTPRNITGAEGGLGIQTWDRNSGAAPTNRGYGGWNSPGFN